MPPNDVLLNDHMARVEQQLSNLVGAIERNTLAVQRAEAEKVPTHVQPYMVEVDCPTTPPTAIQVLPRSKDRKEVGIVNVGPSTLLFNNMWFDPTSILQQFSDPSNPSPILPVPNQVIKIGYLVAGQSVTYQASEGLWLYNVSTTQVALTALYETKFSRAIGVTDPISRTPGLDGALGAGMKWIKDAEGNDVLMRGLV